MTHGGTQGATAVASQGVTTGEEWIVEAFGCEPARLADPAAGAALFDAIVAEVGLNAVAGATWHRFPAPGGYTGLLCLAESHLTVHTFPEHGSACVNLFCCVPRARWAWEARLASLLGAREVRVRHVVRSYGAADAGSRVGSCVVDDVERRADAHAAA